MLDTRLSPRRALALLLHLIVFAVAAATPARSQTPDASPPAIAAPSPTAAPATPASAESASPAPPASPSELDLKLKQAQLDNYLEQTRDIKRKSVWWRSLTEFVGALSPLAALLAVGITIVTFAITQRAARLSQRNTAFLEALKQFGNKDSATLRASAAGTLAHMGRVRDVARGPRWLSPTAADAPSEPYLDTSIDQLVSGLLLEDNPFVLSSISTNLQRLIERDPPRACERLHRANLELQKQLLDALSEFYASRMEAPLRHVPVELRRRAELVTRFPAEVLLAFENRHLNFSGYLESDAEVFKAMSQSKQQDAIVSARDELEIAAERLRINVELYSVALKANPFALPREEFKTEDKVERRLGLGRPEQMDLSKVFLVRAHLGLANLQGVDLSGAQLQHTWLYAADLRWADLSSSRLEGANLTEAQLQGSNLFGARLEEANLHSAVIDEDTDLRRANWWQANFFNYSKELYARGLLEQLYRRHAGDLPAGEVGVHESVRYFLRVREQEETASPPTDDGDDVVGSSPAEAGGGEVGSPPDDAEIGSPPEEGGS